MRSTPATYLEVADDIRKLFAKANKTKADLFSFNGKGGCPVCQGKGVIVSDMAFMDAIETTCEACGGLRYSNEVLSYKVQGMNIAEVMDLTANKASEMFAGTVIAEKHCREAGAFAKGRVGLPSSQPIAFDLIWR